MKWTIGGEELRSEQPCFMLLSSATAVPASLTRGYVTVPQGKRAMPAKHTLLSVM
jgi:hypothetical protein